MGVETGAGLDIWPEPEYERVVVWWMRWLKTIAFFKHQYLSALETRTDTRATVKRTFLSCFAAWKVGLKRKCDIYPGYPRLSNVLVSSLKKQWSLTEEPRYIIICLSLSKYASADSNVSIFSLKNLSSVTTFWIIFLFQKLIFKLLNTSLNLNFFYCLFCQVTTGFSCLNLQYLPRWHYCTRGAI